MEQILALWSQFPHLPCEGIGLSLLLHEDPSRSHLELSYPSLELLMFVGPPWDPPGLRNGWVGEDNGLEDSCMSGQLLCDPVAVASLILSKGAAVSQIRENSQMCSLTYRPLQMLQGS